MFMVFIEFPIAYLTCILTSGSVDKVKFPIAVITFAIASSALLGDYRKLKINVPKIYPELLDCDGF